MCCKIDKFFTAVLLLHAIWVVACRSVPPPPEKQLPVAGDAALKVAPASPAVAAHVVLISVDGLGARQLMPLLEKGQLPSFARFQTQGTTTLDARTDVTDTTTMANHTCMLTGLPSDAPVPGDPVHFHGYHYNRDPPVDATLHNAGNPALAYVPSIFDVAHDRGLRTCMYAGKSKFVLFSRSFDAQNGAPDRIGADNGKNKIDVTVVTRSADETAARFAGDIAAGTPCDLAFVHLAELDASGHESGWAGEVWNAEAVHLDQVIQRLFDAVQASPQMKDKTAFILTADHGGVGTGHGDVKDERNFAVPFFVMGPGIPKGRDLYDVFAATRNRPGNVNPPYGAKLTPVRNGDAGNFALSLLGLPPVPGSVMFGMGKPSK